MAGEVLPEQRERTAGLDDEDARTVNRSHLLQQVDQQRGFAGAGRAEDQHVRVLLAIRPVQGVEHQGFGTPVEEHEPGIAGAARAAIERQQVRDVPGEDQARSAAHPIKAGVVGHGQVAQVAVECQQIRLAGDRLQTVGQ